MRNMIRTAVILLTLVATASFSLNAQRGMGGMRMHQGRMGYDSTLKRMPPMAHTRDSVFNGRRPQFYGMRQFAPGAYGGHFYPGRPGRAGAGLPGYAPGFRDGMIEGFRRGVGPGMRNRPGMAMAEGFRRGMAPGRPMLENIPGLTEKQKEELQKLNQKNREEMQEFMKAREEKMKEMRDAHRKKVLEILNDNQKKWLEEHGPSGRV